MVEGVLHILILHLHIGVGNLSQKLVLQVDMLVPPKLSKRMEQRQLDELTQTVLKELC